MKTIKLPTATYEYDPAKPLGKRGGFGQVFLGRAADGTEVAVKKLHVSADDAGHRELGIADELRGKRFEHVVPFIDSGEDADSGEYYVVMAKAETSLQAAIDGRGPLDVDDTARVLLDLIKGLLEVTELVHRDLKPDNVLLHDGKWKIADFGIARFIDQATATNTLRDCLSPYYAAPEQWRYERSTHATDVYALGCIAFWLLMGKPPFTTNPEEQHQNEPFPPFDCADPRLQALITMMTRKVPAVRPTLSRIHQVLTGIVLTPQSAVAGRGLDELARVSADIVMRQQTWEAQDTAFEARGEKRNQLARAGLEILIDNVERLWGKIHMQAPNAVRNATHGPYVQLLVCNLWGAHLEVRQREPFLKPRKFPNSGWDVVVWCEILTTQDWPRYRWSSSLWYVRLPDAAEYRWYEVSYSRDVTYRGHQEEGFEPFACRMLDHADTAAGPAGQRHLIWTAFGPAAIDDEKEDEFHDRWFWLFAKACRGQLRRPRRFPIAQWPPDL